MSLEELITTVCPPGYTIAFVRRKDGSWSANLMVHNKRRRQPRPFRGIGATVEGVLLDFIQKNQPKD